MLLIFTSPVSFVISRGLRFVRKGAIPARFLIEGIKGLPFAARRETARQSGFGICCKRRQECLRCHPASARALGVLVLAGLAWGMRVTDARPFCSSCHIMEQAARTHKLSPHAKLACNECHAPTALLSKLPFKAKEGARDFYMNTLGDVDLPIVAGMATKDVVNANCKACHFATNENVASMDAKPYCVDCHRSAQHMRMKPISTRMVADE